MATGTALVDGIFAVYQWFKTTKIGYPLRKISKALPDLIIGLVGQAPDKPIWRNSSILLAAALGYTIGFLIPYVFAPSMLLPLAVFADAVISPIGLQASIPVLVGLGAFAFASVISMFCIQVAKKCYGAVFGRSVTGGRVTNQRMLIGQPEKPAVVARIQQQLKVLNPGQTFDESQLNLHETMLLERYVYLRDCVRGIKTDPQFDNRGEAEAALARVKKALSDLREGNWIEVNHYLKRSLREQEDEKHRYSDEITKIEQLSAQYTHAMGPTGLPEDGLLQVQSPPVQERGGLSIPVATAEMNETQKCEALLAFLPRPPLSLWERISGSSRGGQVGPSDLQGLQQQIIKRLRRN